MPADDCFMRFTILVLFSVYLQADNEFVNMLSKIRSGQGGSLVKDLKERCSAPVDLNGIVATKVRAPSLPSGKLDYNKDDEQ